MGYLTTLRGADVAFVDDQLGRRFADLRFTICLKGQKTRRRVSLLFEHKRNVRYTTPRQLFSYMTGEIEQTADSEALPAILTVVLVQQGEWNRPTRLSSEYDLPEHAREILSPYLLDFGFIPVRLSEIDESGLKGTTEGRFALALLKSVGEGSPFSWTKFISVLKDLAEDPKLDKIFRRAESYLLSTTDESREPEVRKAIAGIPDQFPIIKEVTMTLGEAIEKRGEKRGRVKLLRNMLEKAYPDLKEREFDRMEELKDSSLEALAETIVLQRSVEDVRRLLKGQ